MIRDQDQIAQPPMTPWRNSPNCSPLERELITEGDAAVEPLLAALETDLRLTRTVSYGRGISIDRRMHAVFGSELAALKGILKTSRFRDASDRLDHRDLAARNELARTLRALWMADAPRPLDEGPCDSLNER